MCVRLREGKCVRVRKGTSLDGVPGLGARVWCIRSDHTSGHWPKARAEANLCKSILINCAREIKITTRLGQARIFVVNFAKPTESN